MAPSAVGDGNRSSPAITRYSGEEFLRILDPPRKSFRKPPKFTNEPPPDLKLPSQPQPKPTLKRIAQPTANRQQSTYTSTI